MTSSRTLTATGALVATLAVAGCSFSGGARSSGGSASTTSPSPRSSAAPAKPATPETETPATPSTAATTTPPGTQGSPPAGSPAPKPPPANQAPEDQAAGGQAAGTAGPQGSGPSRCTADALDYQVPVPVESGGGSAFATTSLVLRNTGSTTCTLYGYPGISFVAGDDRHQVGTSADQQPGTTPSRVTLVPGSAALAPLTIAANASVGAGACRPTDVVGLKIYPPGSKEAVLVDRPATACGAPDAHQLVVGPVQTG